jgi:N-acyl-D-aspartate/D-glutamate deacylase
VTFSDSGAHVSQIMDASLQTHLLSYWVREKQAFTLEHAVRMLSFDNATHWGFADRGLIREGMAADLVVFDPDTVAPEMPEVVNDLPAGARRLVQRARGDRGHRGERGDPLARRQAHGRAARSAAARAARPENVTAAARGRP